MNQIIALPFRLLSQKTINQLRIYYFYITTFVTTNYTCMKGKNLLVNIFCLLIFGVVQKRFKTNGGAAGAIFGKRFAYFFNQWSAI